MATPRLTQVREHRDHQRASDTLPLPRRHYAEVQDLRFVECMVRDDVADDRAVIIGDEKRHTGPDAVAQVALGPRVRKHRPLDRGDLRDVSGP